MEEIGRKAWCMVTKSEIRLATFLLVGLLLVLFWRMIFLREVLSPADLLYDLPTWQGVASKDFVRPSNPLLSDQIMLFRPWMILASKLIRNGALPLWNPMILCGIPLLGNYESAIFYPLSVLHYLLPVDIAFTLIAFAKLLVIGIFTYLFLKLIAVGKFGALVGAVTFMLSGFVIVWILFPMTNVVVFLPILFFLTEKLIREDNKKLWAVLLGLSVGCQFLGGHPPASVQILTVVSLYFVFRVVHFHLKHRSRNGSLRLVAWYSSALATGALLASFQILPFLEYMRYGTGSPGDVTPLLHVRQQIGFLGDIMCRLIVPDFWGNPADANYWGTPNYNEHTLYVGILPCVLAVLAVVVRRREKPVSFFVAAALICLALRSELFWTGKLLWFFPTVGWALERPSLTASFSLAVLAGIGASTLSHEGVGERGKRKATMNSSVAVALGAAILVAFYAIRYLDEILKRSLLRYELTNIGFFLLWMGSGVCLILLFSAEKIKAKHLVPLLIGITCADLLHFGINYNPWLKKEKICPVPEVISFLQRDVEPFRVLALGNVLPPNTSVNYDIYDIGGYTAFIPTRYKQYLIASQIVDSDQTELSHGSSKVEMVMPEERTLFRKFDSPLIDLLNVKYILAAHGWSEEFREREKYERVFEAGIDVYRNKGVFPRSFVVHSYLVKDKIDEILQTLSDPSFDPRNTVVLEHPPPEFGAGPAERSDMGLSTCEIERYGAKEVTILAAMHRPGFVVLSDMYYPGWKVYIDGEERSILRANGTLRAVAVEEGKHVVRFVYKPWTFRLGAIISSLAFVFLIGSLIYSACGKRGSRDGR